MHKDLHFCNWLRVGERGKPVIQTLYCLHGLVLMDFILWNITGGNINGLLSHFIREGFVGTDHGQSCIRQWLCPAQLADLSDNIGEGEGVCPVSSVHSLSSLARISFVASEGMRINLGGNKQGGQECLGPDLLIS